VLVSPPVGKAIPKGRFTSGFVARLLCEKFVLGCPAHRIVAALAHDGLHVAEGTLAGVFTACSGLLGPLAHARLPDHRTHLEHAVGVLRLLALS